MASQSQDSSRPSQSYVELGKKPTSTSNLQIRLESGADSTLNKLLSQSRQTMSKAQNGIDRMVPPNQRADLVTKCQAFVSANPKLSALLAVNLAFSGIPLGIFAVFGLTGLVSALATGLVVSTIAVVTFSMFAIGVAFTVLLPVVFFSTFLACSLFLWGLFGYYVYRWATSRAIGVEPKTINGAHPNGFNSAAPGLNAKGGTTRHYDHVLEAKWNSSEVQRSQSSQTT